MLVEMPTEVEGDTKDEWIDRQATIVKIEDSWYLMHSNVGPLEESTRWFLSMRVHRAPQPFSCSTPRYGGLPRDDNSTARQVGPILDLVTLGMQLVLRMAVSPSRLSCCQGL